MRFASGLASLSVLAVLASGCSAFSDDSSGGDGATTVAAAFYPLAWVAERVAEGTDTEVQLLTQPGTEPHDLELGVQETAQVVEADLVVFEAGFQPAVDDTVEQNAEGVTLDAAEVIDLLPVEESAEEHEEHAGEEEGHAEEEAHAEDSPAESESHAEEEGHADEHDHGDLDPHFWQDPIRVAELGDALAEELGEIDADHAKTYTANAEKLREELVALDESYTSGLDDCERDAVVVSHDAFGYLEKYDLHVAPIVGLSPDAEPTAAVLGELQELIREEGITTVFSEPLEPALGENLAKDLGIANGVLDPIEGLTDENAGEDYLSLMEANLEALTTANGCR